MAAHSDRFQHPNILPIAHQLVPTQKAKACLPLQAQCLMQPGVLSGGNLVYCAPTSGGKSAVAEILMLRRLITTGRTAMLVMPFVTLCAEKSAHLELLLKPLEK